MSKKCVGCGILLQDEDALKDGYVEDINHDLCRRCFMIKNYGHNDIVLKNNIDYIKILNKIGDKDLVVYVSSILTVNLDYIDKFKNVILVLTKRDIIPKSVKDGKIIKYLKERYSNILDIVIVSAYKKYNLDLLYDKLCLYGNDREIYFVGITNSGKSSLINGMIKSYSMRDGVITTSNYPSTTLDVITENIGDLKIKDTPGIVINDSIVNYLSETEIKKINSKKEIKPLTFQVKGKGVKIIDNIMRIEYDTDESSMTFYMSNNLSIKSISLKNEMNRYEHFKVIELDNDKDIVIEDVGFIKCTKPIKVRIYYRDSLCVRVRDNLI